MTEPMKPEDGVKPEEGKVELSDEDLEGVHGGGGDDQGSVLDPLTGELLTPGDDGYRS